MIGSQLFIGYRVRHFSKPLEIMKRFSPSVSCFLKPAGRRKRPFASTVASYSPRKPIMWINSIKIYHLLTQNNTFYHFYPKSGSTVFFHKKQWATMLCRLDFDRFYCVSFVRFMWIAVDNPCRSRKHWWIRAKTTLKRHKTSYFTCA